jgi:hypothetical protein
MAVKWEDLRQPFVKRTKYKSNKIYKFWSLYNFGEKSLLAQREFGFIIIVVDKLSFTWQTLSTKTHKKYCHVGILEAVDFYCEGPIDKLFHSTNQIGRILCLLKEQS